MDTIKKWSTSVVAIVVAFILFWPIGCVLLYLRWVNNNGKYKAVTNTLLVCGIILVIFGLTGFMVYAEDKDPSYIVLSIFIFEIPGFICTFFGIKRNKKFKVLNKYLDFINVRKKIEIDSLCNRFCIAPDIVISDLETMLKLGMIKGYLTENELILDGYKNENIEDNIEYKPIISQKDTKIIKCKECGAKNSVIVGEKKECEYCGTLLQ